MGRSALVIKTVELQGCVNSLEAEAEFATLGELCIAIENSAWGKNIRNVKHAVRGLSAQVAAREIKNRGIVCKTKPGKRGRGAGVRINKSSRKDKVATLNITKFASALKEELKDVPDKYKRYIEPTLEGNPIAAMKLHCGRCMGFCGAEVSCDGGLGGSPCPLYVLNRLSFNKRKEFKANKDGFYELRKILVESQDSA